MKRIKYITSSFVFSALLLCFTQSCKKYPDDPFISLKRPDKRIEGKWLFTSYQINGVEHIHDFDSILNPYSLNHCYITFDPNSYNIGSLTQSGEYKIQNENEGDIIYTPNGGRAYLINRKKVISFNSGMIPYTIDSTAVYNFYYKIWNNTRQYISEWEIIELYDKTLHIRQNNIDIHFNKQ